MNTDPLHILVSEQWTSDFCEDYSRTWVLPRSFACHCYTLVVWYHMNFKENQNRSSILLPWKSCSVDCWHIKQNSLKQPTKRTTNSISKRKPKATKKDDSCIFSPHGRTARCGTSGNSRSWLGRLAEDQPHLERNPGGSHWGVRPGPKWSYRVPWQWNNSQLLYE